MKRVLSLVLLLALTQLCRGTDLFVSKPRLGAFRIVLKADGSGEFHMSQVVDNQQLAPIYQAHQTTPDYPGVFYRHEIKRINFMDSRVSYVYKFSNLEDFQTVIESRKLPFPFLIRQLDDDKNELLFTANGFAADVIRLPVYCGAELNPFADNGTYVPCDYSKFLQDQSYLERYLVYLNRDNFSFYLELPQGAVIEGSDKGLNQFTYQLDCKKLIKMFYGRYMKVAALEKLSVLKILVQNVDQTQKLFRIAFKHPNGQAFRCWPSLKHNNNRNFDKYPVTRRGVDEEEELGTVEFSPRRISATFYDSALGISKLKIDGSFQSAELADQLEDYFVSPINPDRNLSGNSDGNFASQCSLSQNKPSQKQASETVETNPYSLDLRCSFDQVYEKIPALTGACYVYLAQKKKNSYSMKIPGTGVFIFNWPSGHKPSLDRIRSSKKSCVIFVHRSAWPYVISHDGFDLETINDFYVLSAARKGGKPEFVIWKRMTLGRFLYEIDEFALPGINVKQE